MVQTQIADVVVPAEFSAYIVENSMVSTAIFQSGVALPSGLISKQLQAGSTQFTVPAWSDDGENETDVTSDNIAVLGTPLKLTAVPQVVRKSFLHQSWSEMSLASELVGSEALARVQSRVQAYWDRHRTPFSTCYQPDCATALHHHGQSFPARSMARTNNTLFSRWTCRCVRRSKSASVVYRA